MRARSSEPNGVGWRFRAFRNRFPTFEPTRNGATTKSDRGTGPRASSARLPVPPAGARAVGHHEVIVETPRHVRPIGVRPVREIAALLEFYQRRLVAAESRFPRGSALLFRNQGPRSGGSLAHPHAQLVAAPFVFPTLAAELARARPGLRAGRRRTCALEADVRLAERRRSVVVRRGGITAYVPGAGTGGFSVRLVPSTHAPSFTEATSSELRDLAAVVRAVLPSLERSDPTGSTNFWIHSLPAGTPANRAFHWHAEAVSRAPDPDGFELSSRVAVRTLEPRAIADRLRGGFAR